MTQSERNRRILRIVVGFGMLCALLSPLQVFGQTATPSPQASGKVAHLSMRVISDATAKNIAGVIVGQDANGQAITNLDPKSLQATLDGRSVELSLVQGRPSIAFAAGFYLDSAATPQVRDALANALAENVKGIDLNRDSFTIVSTSDPKPWDQAVFTNSPDEFTKSLNQVIQADPNDDMASLEQVSGALRALAAQQKDTKVLLLYTNRPLVNGTSVNFSLGTVRTFAVESGVQINIVALPGAGGQGPAEALAEATPGGRVEYVFNATNRTDISKRVGPLLAPAFGARRFELPSPNEGSHTLSVAAPGVLPVAATFVTAGRSVPIVSLETANGTLKSGGEIKEPTWVQARPAENLPIDGVEWSIDGKVTQVTTEPYAILLDPEALGDGQHDLTARITSQGRAGPFFGATIYVPADILRTLRNAVRSWGLIAALLAANVLVLYLFIRFGRLSGGGAGTTTEFPPMLRLTRSPDSHTYLSPDTITFPAKGKLRIGYHPPYMDDTVNHREFSKLPFQDIRGDDEAVRDLSRYVACIWRDPKTNDCYIQLGWPGGKADRSTPGEPIVPKPQSQVTHFGKVQDATTKPVVLAHMDEVRLASGIVFTFSQVGLRDKATPESKKLSPFEARASDGRAKFIPVSDARRRQAANNQESMAEEG
ncbi:MAG TPA: hypothetical protein VKV73_26895 [Chloroflexota bacterium]|nr:hypothetical protein [Chloroflexota bacterium]